MGAACDERRVFQYAASVNSWIEERNQVILDGVEEFIDQAGTQEFEQVLVGHMQEDRFVFKPTGREGPNPTNAVRLVLQRRIKTVHPEFSIE